MSQSNLTSHQIIEWLDARIGKPGIVGETRSDYYVAFRAQLLAGKAMAKALDELYKLTGKMWHLDNRLGEEPTAQQKLNSAISNANIALTAYRNAGGQ